MKKLLIYGAGAIGRGYVPWVFSPDLYELSYVEANETLRSQLNKSKKFTTFCTRENGYVSLTVPVKACFSPGEEVGFLSEFDGIILCVGPRQVIEIAETLAQAPCPIVAFENDDSIPGILQKMTGKSDIYFGIPDVITSNTATPEHLKHDALSIITEDGTCFIDDRASALGGACTYVPQDELKKQWLAKLYIHNTPHCIAAYLGSLSGHTYLHEGMQHPKTYSLVQSAMYEMRDMLRVRYKIDTEFLDWYSQKELDRFSNVLLYDPISRVAREPFRKLAPDNRLIGAAQLALASGIVPTHLIKGIMAACLYDKQNDPDFNITYLMNALSPENFLKLIIGLHPHEALFKLIVDAWEITLAELKECA